MTLLVVRHATAGKRREWEGDDRLRPLDERGWKQAEALPEALAGFESRRVLSSGYDRCVQTVEPLGLPVEVRRELEEGAGREPALALMKEVGGEAVMCTHGDVLEALFGEKGKKGSTRVVELLDGEPVVLETIPPPA